MSNPTFQQPQMYTQRAPAAFPSSAYLGVGLTFLVLGGFLLGASMEDGTASDAATFIAILSLAFIVAGQIMTLIGIIAKGVKLGNRES